MKWVAAIVAALALLAQWGAYHRCVTNEAHGDLSPASAIMAAACLTAIVLGIVLAL